MFFDQLCHDKANYIKSFVHGKLPASQKIVNLLHDFLLLSSKEKL